MTGDAANAGRILIVDDNPGIHRDFDLVLGESSVDLELEAEEQRLYGGPGAAVVEKPVYVLDHASSGLEGLDRVKRSLEEARPYQLAFVDIRMPGIDGVETIARLWRIDPRVQIVICTAYADYSWEELVQRLGRTDQLLVLKKPFDNLEVTLLASTLTEKWFLGRRAALNFEQMERLVAQRTQRILTLEPSRSHEPGAHNAAAALGDEAGAKELPLLLLVSANARVRESITRALGSGYRLVETNTAANAVQQTQELIPDLVLLDPGLPNLDGAAFSRQLQASELSSHIPIVLLDGLKTAEPLLAAAPGEMQHLPLDSARLKSGIEQLLQRLPRQPEKLLPEASSPARPLATNQLEARFLRRMVEIIERHLADYEFDVDALAQKLALSRRQLFRKLKAVTDLTPNIFIRNLRLRRAAQLLKDSGLTVTEVTYAVGFADLKHFRSLFREHFGVLPGEFAARANNAPEASLPKPKA